MNNKPQTSVGFAKRLHARIDNLYHGKSTRSNYFRWGLVSFDLLTLLYFILASFLHHGSVLHIIEEFIGALFLIEFLARLYISTNKLRDIFHPVGLADILVIATLLAPSFTESFGFLRVIRTLRLLRSYHILNELRQQSNFVRIHGDVIFSVINLSVFIFVITAVVYVTQVDDNPLVNDYVDALYFTIATLTTTGFGDITLIGTGGHILAVIIMVFGISLFLHLVQTIIRPNKIRYECPACGLYRHDADAVHCKHCGHLLHITTSGLG